MNIDIAYPPGSSDDEPSEFVDAMHVACSNCGAPAGMHRFAPKSVRCLVYTDKAQIDLGLKRSRWGYQRRPTSSYWVQESMNEWTHGLWQRTLRCPVGELQRASLPVEAVKAIREGLTTFVE